MDAALPTQETAPRFPRPLKILHMAAVDFTIRQFLLPLGEGLRAAGHEVVFASTPGPYRADIETAGFRFVANPVSRSLNAFAHAAATWRTWRLLRRERFDVVHVHTPIAALVGRLAARLAGVRLKIYTAHGFYFHDDMPARKRRLFVGLEKTGAACGDFIMTVSKEDEASALAAGVASPGAIETIYNGIDTVHFDPARAGAADRAEVRSRLGIPEDAPVVGIVGRLVREKGFFELLDAAAILRLAHPETRWLVVGDVLPSDHDGIGAAFAERVAELGLDAHVIRAGLVKDTAPYLAAMDVFTLPSYREGMPISLLEAMSMGLPCVATDIRGCREEVVEGETGHLVPARNSVALAGAIGGLLSDSEKARRMGEAGRRRVLEVFDIRRVVAHQLQIYARLAAGRFSA